MNGRLSQSLSVDRIQQYLIRELEFEEKDALRKAYQVRMFLRSIFVSVIVLVVAYYLGYFFQSIYLLFFCKFLRTNCGGIHVKSKILCFSTSVMLIICSLLFGTVEMAIEAEVVLWAIILFIYIRYVPKGTSYRPITKIDEIKRMKRNTGILLLWLFLTRVFHVTIYQSSLLACLLIMILVTPISYHIFKVKETRNQ